jgi:hypothetical protein
MDYNHVYADPSAVQLIHIVNISSDIDIFCPRQLKIVDRGQNTLVLLRKRAKMSRKHEKAMPRTSSKGYKRTDRSPEGKNNAMPCRFQCGEA